MNNPKLKYLRITIADNGYIVDLERVHSHPFVGIVHQIISKHQGTPEPGDEWKKDLPGNVQPAEPDKQYEQHVFPDQASMLAFIQKYTS